MLLHLLTTEAGTERKIAASREKGLADLGYRQAAAVHLFAGFRCASGLRRTG